MYEHLNGLQCMCVCCVLWWRFIQVIGPYIKRINAKRRRRRPHSQIRRQECEIRNPDMRSTHLKRNNRATESDTARTEAESRNSSRSRSNSTSTIEKSTGGNTAYGQHPVRLQFSIRSVVARARSRQPISKQSSNTLE